MGGFLGILLGVLGVLAAYYGSGPTGQAHRMHVGIAVAVMDILIVALAYVGIVILAPRAQSPDFVRTLVLTAAVIALGGISVCSGIFTS